MFDSGGSGVGFLSGESGEDLAADDQLAYEVTCRELAVGWVGDDRHVLPGGFESLPLDFLAVLVSRVDRSRLNGFDLVRLLRVEHRLESSFAGGKLASMAEVAYSTPGSADSLVERSPDEIAYAACEIGTALAMTRRMSESRLEVALALTGPLVRVGERLRSGDIDLARARKFVDALSHLSLDVIDAVLDRCLDDASELTTGQLGALLARLALRADPSGSAHSMKEGLLDRKAASVQNPDLTANLGIYSVHPLAVAEAMSNVERIARSLKTDGEGRTLDQLKADVALDLLKGTVAGNSGGMVMVTVPAATLEAAADEPGVLEGFGPVTAEIARKAVMERVDGQWEFQVTDNGRAVATGTLARRPTAAQKRRIRADYATCVFPGCRQPSYNCDLDHRRPHALGGSTHNDNLAPLCRHHHMVRHHSPWLLDRSDNGDHASRAALELLEFP